MSNDKTIRKTISTKYSRTLYSAKSVLVEAGIKIDPNKYYQFWPTSASASQTSIVQNMIDRYPNQSDWVKGSELYKVGILAGTVDHPTDAFEVKIADQIQSHDPIGKVKSYEVSYAVQMAAGSLNNHAPTIEFMKQPIAGKKYKLSDVVKTTDPDGDKIQSLFIYTSQSSYTNDLPGPRVYFDGKEMDDSTGFLIFEEQRQYVTIEFPRGQDKAAISGWTKDEKGISSSDAYYPKAHIFNVKK